MGVKSKFRSVSMSSALIAPFVRLISVQKTPAQDVFPMSRLYRNAGIVQLRFVLKNHLRLNFASNVKTSRVKE